MKIILENAVAALKAEAQRIEIAISHLTGIIGGTTTATSAPPAPATDPVKTHKAKAKAKPRKVTPIAKVPAVQDQHRTEVTTDQWTPRPGSITHQGLVALSKAPEPFSVASLLVVLPDMDKAALGTELWKLGRAGYVAEAGKEGNAKLYKRGSRTIIAA